MTLPIITVPINEVYEPFREIARKAVAEGYYYSCECGESFQTAEAASNCNKCRRNDITQTVIYYTPPEA